MCLCLYNVCNNFTVYTITWKILKRLAPIILCELSGLLVSMSLHLGSVALPAVLRWGIRAVQAFLFFIICLSRFTDVCMSAGCTIFILCVFDLTAFVRHWFKVLFTYWIQNSVVGGRGVFDWVTSWERICRSDDGVYLLGAGQSAVCRCCAWDQPTWQLVQRPDHHLYTVNEDRLWCSQFYTLLSVSRMRILTIYNRSIYLKALI